MQPSQVRPARYAALGDSYTIGTAVDASDRWPDQLVGAYLRHPVVRSFRRGGRRISGLVWQSAMLWVDYHLSSLDLSGS